MSLLKQPKVKKIPSEDIIVLDNVGEHVACLPVAQEGVLYTFRCLCIFPEHVRIPQERD